MIVRRAVLRSLIDVSKNAEMEVGILIEYFSFGFRIRAEILGNEFRIGGRLFGVVAHEFAARRAGILQ